VSPVGRYDAVGDDVALEDVALDEVPEDGVALGGTMAL
jgi:hypothetical protein